jgi:T4 RnlA family RNA ligase
MIIGGIRLKEDLDALVEAGYLICAKHKSLPLTIYNYSQKTQYEKYWNEITLACRGLVLDDNGQIIARPFAKFFNSSEVESKIPNKPFRVYEKMDGSLGIFFWYEGYPVFASRGSFSSEQAIRGAEILRKKYNATELKQFHTYMFEIIYPENRIVVDYGDMEDLVMLGVIHTKSGDEIERHVIEKDYKDIFNLVIDYNITESWVHLKSLNEFNKEGYVIRFNNGFRMKVKHEEYVRLHRIITNISNLDIWKCLKFGESFDDFLERVPDEFYNWVKEVETELKSKHLEIMNAAFADYNKLVYEIEFTSQKEFAEAIKERLNKSLLFSIRSSKLSRLNEEVWDMIRPTWSKPFMKNLNE